MDEINRSTPATTLLRLLHRQDEADCQPGGDQSTIPELEGVVAMAALPDNGLGTGFSKAAKHRQKETG